MTDAMLNAARDEMEIQSVPFAAFSHVPPLSPIPLVDHSNRRTAGI
jgi:hypothetical protein